MNNDFVYLKDISEIKFIVGLSKSNTNTKSLKWITASHLLPDNNLSLDFDEKTNSMDEAQKIQKEDILIKRISPLYINYIDIDFQDVYAYNNLIIVRPNKFTDSKYLAYILNQIIKKISLRTSIGAVMPSLGRCELETLKISLLPTNKQKSIGEIWYYDNEKKKHLKRLTELQSIKNSYMLNQYIMNKTGGIGNDNI